MSDTQQDAAASVVRAFDALGRGDGPAALGLLAPTLSWTEAERFPYYSGTWTTPQEVAEKLLGRLGTDWDGFSAGADDYLTSGDEVVSFGIYRGVNRRTGKTLAAPFAHRWTVRDGRIVRFLMYTDTAKVLQTMS